jgi:hypothetical protein
MQAQNVMDAIWYPSDKRLHDRRQHRYIAACRVSHGQVRRLLDLTPCRQRSAALLSRTLTIPTPSTTATAKVIQCVNLQIKHVCTAWCKNVWRHAVRSARNRPPSWRRMTYVCCDAAGGRPRAPLQLQSGGRHASVTYIGQHKPSDANLADRIKNRRRRLPYDGVCGVCSRSFYNTVAIPISTGALCHGVRAHFDRHHCRFARSSQPCSHGIKVGNTISQSLRG